MSNFARYFPSGFPFEGEIPSSWIEWLDSIMTKIPNGTDGSTHVGTLTLGGVVSSHIRNKETTATRDTTGSNNFDCNLTNSLVMTCNPAAPITVTLNFMNVAQGDRLRFTLSTNPSHRLTLAWAGAGISHDFLGEEEDQPIPYDGGFTTWEGWANSATNIIWKAVRYAG